MSIIKAFDTAFKRKQSRGWDKIYVAVDIHDTIFRACYENIETYEYFPSAMRALRMLTERRDVCLILWTSSFEDKIADYLKRFQSDKIVFDYVNENPEVTRTPLADFSRKFYINVGIDDHFGFDPEKDWKKVLIILRTNREE